MPEHERYQYVMAIQIQKPCLAKPTICEKDGSTCLMTPMDARQRNMTYAAALTVDLDVHVTTFNPETNESSIETKRLNNVSLGRLPIMVRSRYCILDNTQAHLTSGEWRLDCGGYFIVNGTEQVIISSDRIAENKTYVFTTPKVSPYSHVAELRSVEEARPGGCRPCSCHMLATLHMPAPNLLQHCPGVPKTVSLKITSRANQYGRCIRAGIHHIRQDIPLFVLFKALGVENDKAIMECIVGDVEDPANAPLLQELAGSANEAQGVLCARDAQEFIGQYMGTARANSSDAVPSRYSKLNLVKGALERELLPHVGKSNYHKKALYLGHMTKRLIQCVLSSRDLNDRDSYCSKRVDTVSPEQCVVATKHAAVLLTCHSCM